MTVVRRALDALAVALAGLAVAVASTGGWTIAGVAITAVGDVVVALVLVLGARALLGPIRWPGMRTRTALALAVVTYVVVMSFIVLVRHRMLKTHALDLGYYVQVVWSMATGHALYVTMPPMHPWGDHLSPVLYAFVPFAWIVSGPTLLLVGQTLGLAAGALAVFAVARRSLRDDRIALAFAVLYLLNPSLQGINVRDMHPQAFAIPLLIAAAYAFDTDRFGWCGALLALTLACREDAAIAVIGFGLWLAFARRRWLPGVALMGTALALLALDVRVIMPYFRGEPYSHLFRWAYLGHSFGEILVNIAIRPWRWIAIVATPARLVYLVAMLAPLGFLPLFAPGTVVGALPALAMNLMSVDYVLFNFRAQYQAFVLPFLFLAAIDGYAHVARAVPGGRPRPIRLPAWISPGLAIGVAFVASGALAARTTDDLQVSRWRVGPEQRAAYRLMAKVPPLASVAANERLVPHLAQRPEVFVFPGGIQTAEYVIDLSRVVASVPSPYVAVAHDGGWTLWEREGVRRSAELTR